MAPSLPYMLGLCNGGAKAIWSPKSTNEFAIMNKGVLPRKIEAIRVNTTCPKYFMMMVKPLKGIIQGRKAVRIMYVTPSYVAKFQEGTYRLHHLVWYMTVNRR